MRQSSFSDPAAFKASIVPPKTPMRLAAGLDLGTNTGIAYAYFKPGEPFIVGQHFFALGQWDLSAGPFDSGSLRFVKLRQCLHVLQPDIVFFENVRYTPAAGGITKFNAAAILARAATSCEFFGALKATVCTWCEENDVPVTGLDIGAIKRRATGRGNANKEDVIRACNTVFGSDLDPETYTTTGADNVADSAFVLLLGLEQLGAGVDPIRKRPKVD